MVLFSVPGAWANVVENEPPLFKSHGGSQVDFHALSLSSFHSQVGGSPISIGGMGCVALSDSICFGGGGAATTTTGGTSNLAFGMGYGGLIFEYYLKTWMAFRVTVGGGGYKISRLVSESENTLQYEKLGSGGFFVVHPKWIGTFRVTKWLTLCPNVGYFITGVPRLSSPTLGLNLFFG